MVDVVFLLNPSAECFSIQMFPLQASFPWRLAQNSILPLPFGFPPAAGPSRSFAFQQSRQTVSFQSDRPNTPPTVAHPRAGAPPPAGHALCDQKQPMKTMIIPRLFRTANLVLESEDDCGRIGNLEWFHSSMKPRSINMRN